MQESAMRRMATLEVIRYTIENLTGLVDRQVELAGSEIKEGVVNMVRGAGVLILGMGGLVMMTMALLVAGVLALSLLTARVAFFFMAKGYQSIRALEGGLQARQSRELTADVDGAGPSETREAA